MNNFYRRFGKRIFDLVVSAGLSCVALPLLGVAATAVRIFMGKPVMFKQLRPGLHGKPFELLKLRSMAEPHNRDGCPLTEDERLSGFGRLLRSTSIDELPELLNVIRGDMSLVGPRPLLMEYLPWYSEQQARRHEVRPGLTGWAQINGRNEITWQERFELDVWYVDHLSLSLDVRILGRTIANVLRRQGISAEGEATMPRFMGED